MRRELLVQHELRHAIVHLGEAGRPVEGQLLVQDLLADARHVVPRPVGAQHAVALLHQTLEALRDIEDREGDEQAVPRGVNERRRLLEGPHHVRLIPVELIQVPATCQNLRGDGVARGVVGPHGADGVRHPDALDPAGLIGRHSLALHRGRALIAESVGRELRALAHDVPQRRALADVLVQPLDRCLAVAERRQPGVHRHGDGVAGLDGVQPQVVAQPGQLGHRVQIVDAAVSAHRPRRLILDAGDDLLTVLVVPRVRALDHAAGVAGVVVEFLAQPLLVPLEDRLARGGRRALEAPLAEVAGGVGAGLVDDVHQHSRAVGV